MCVQILGHGLFPCQRRWVAASSPKDLGMVLSVGDSHGGSAWPSRHPQSSVSLRFEAATHMPGYFHTHVHGVSVNVSRHPCSECPGPFVLVGAVPCGCPGSTARRPIASAGAGDACVAPTLLRGMDACQNIFTHTIRRSCELSSGVRSPCVSRSIACRAHTCHRAYRCHRRDSCPQRRRCHPGFPVGSFGTVPAPCASRS